MVFEFPKNNQVMKWLQDGVQRANKISWRLIATKRNKIKKTVRKTKDVVVLNKGDGLKVIQYLKGTRTVFSMTTKMTVVSAT